ncbi:Rho GTPase activating protein with PAK-box/P21-Rho-binding domain-containing protein [Tanacetum coccineum]
MAPSTRIVSASNSNGDEGITREYLDSQLAKMRNLIATLGLQQNQAMNQDAYSLTRLQEAILDVVKKKNKPSGSFNSNRFGNGGNYGNKYTPGHKCAGQLFSLVLVPDDEDCIDNEEENKKSMGIQELQPQISLNSLTRTNNFQTMKNMAKKLGFSIRPTGPLAVTVADGNNLITTSECKKFQWKFNNTIFTTDVMVLPLGGCEMVLGMQLLATLGDIKCNFKDLRMEFKAQSRMKSHADKGRTDKQFDCGDWVFLKLQPHRQVSLRHPNPDQACGKLPLCDPSGVFIVEPLTILDRRMAKKGNGMEIYVLVNGQMTYKFLNTIIDDLFAFVIKMSILHRLSVFRDANEGREYVFLLDQNHLYSEGGLQAEGIFRIIGDDGQEEDVRNQLNRGFVPDGVDVHFLELPTGVLNSLTPEHVIHCNTENECTQLAKSLPPTEAALLDRAINLMADVMVDPLTALIHAVQIMNLLKTLIMKTLCEREESSSGFEPLSSCANNRSPNNKVEHPYLLKNATLKRLGSENEEQFWTFPRMSGSLVEFDYMMGQTSPVTFICDSLESEDNSKQERQHHKDAIIDGKLKRLHLRKGVRRFCRVRYLMVSHIFSQLHNVIVLL